jgi:hypothetical protein
MKYLNISALQAIPTGTFKNAKPFPWVNPQGALSEEGYSELIRTLPDVSLFEKSIGMERAYGQKPHDRYELKYRDGLPLSPQWTQFLSELNSPEYHAEIARLFGTSRFTLRYQWQYSFAGCSVSPHCDSKNKVGTHIFYMNTPENWKDEWGGRTLILDDGGVFPPESAPGLSEFKNQTAAEVFGNRSLLFERTDRSWHAVSELVSPEGAMRQIFTVVMDRTPSLFEKLSRKVKKLFSVG